MNEVKIAFFISLILILASAKSFAMVEANLLIGESLATPYFAATGVSYTATSQTFLSYGALANLRFLGDTSSLTTGLMYTELGGRISAVSSSTDVEEVLKIPYIVIPIIFDYWFIPTYLTGGAGFYYGFPGGNVTENGSINSGGTVSAVNQSQSFSAANIKGDDYGLLLHAQFNYPFMEIFYATFQVMYVYGLENVSTANNPSTMQHNTSLMMLLGAGLGF